MSENKKKKRKIEESSSQSKNDEKKELEDFRKLFWEMIFQDKNGKTKMDDESLMNFMSLTDIELEEIPLKSDEELMEAMIKTARHKIIGDLIVEKIEQKAKGRDRRKKIEKLFRLLYGKDDNTHPRINEICENLAYKFFHGKLKNRSYVHQRETEKELIEEGNPEIINIFLFQGKVLVPYEVIQIILSYAKKNNILLTTLGLTCKDFYLAILQNWETIKITHFNLYKISLLVLKCVKELILTQISNKSDFDYIFDKLPPKNLKILDLRSLCSYNYGGGDYCDFFDYVVEKNVVFVNMEKIYFRKVKFHNFDNMKAADMNVFFPKIRTLCNISAENVHNFDVTKIVNLIGLSLDQGNVDWVGRIEEEGVETLNKFSTLDFVSLKSLDISNINCEYYHALNFDLFKNLLFLKCKIEGKVKVGRINWRVNKLDKFVIENSRIHGIRDFLDVLQDDLKGDEILYPKCIIISVHANRICESTYRSSRRVTTREVANFIKVVFKAKFVESLNVEIRFGNGSYLEQGKISWKVNGSDMTVLILPQSRKIWNYYHDDIKDVVRSFFEYLIDNLCDNDRILNGVKRIILKSTIEYEGWDKGFIKGFKIKEKKFKQEEELKIGERVLKGFHEHIFKRE